jgi:hypothetical protein
MRGFLMSEQFNIIKIPVLMGSLRGLLKATSEFAVTPKSKAEAARWHDVRLLLTVQLSTLPAVGIGMWRLFHADSSYRFWALVVNLSWAVFYFFLVGPLLIRALKQAEHRAAYRFPRMLQVPVRFAYTNAKGAAVSDTAFARNLNRTGLSLTLTAALAEGLPVDLDLKLPTGRVLASGQVVRRQAVGRAMRTASASSISHGRIETPSRSTCSGMLQSSTARCCT